MTKSKSVLMKLLINGVAIIGLYLIFSVLMDKGIINDYHQGVIVLIGINIIAAASLNLATGILGQLALGHAGFMAIGAYSGALFAKGYGKVMISNGTSQGVVLLIAVVIAGTMAAIAGIIIGVPALRLRGDYLAIVTLGFGEIIRIAINNLEITKKARPITGVPHYVKFTEIYILVVVVLAILVLLIVSRHGRAILSIREDEIAAEAVGINTTKYKIIGFTTSAFFAGVAGAALAFHSQIIDPKKFTFMYSVEILIIVVLGGMGSLTGTVVAAVILGVLNEFLHFIDTWRMVIYSLLLVVMMIVRPGGILGTKEFSLVGFLKKIYSKINKKERTV